MGDPQIVTGLMAGLQIIKFVTAQIERNAAGQIGDAELVAQWKAMGIDVAEANRLWQAAGAAPGGAPAPDKTL